MYIIRVKTSLYVPPPPQGQPKGSLKGTPKIVPKTANLVTYGCNLRSVDHPTPHRSWD